MTGDQLTRKAPPEYAYADHVRRVVDNCPPLTAEQKHRLAALLRPFVHKFFTS